MAFDLSMHAELALRVVVGTALGAVIGYERDIHGRPAGLRTHALVALASATFMVVSTHFVYFQQYAAGDLVMVDPSRIAASVVTGIGFLAGGAILRSGISVQGLTTAAGLWLVAAIGLAAGSRMYAESVLATVLGIVALTALRRFEDKDDKTVRHRMSLGLADEAPPLAKLIETLGAQGARVRVESVERDVVEHRSEVIFDIRLPIGVTAEQAIASVEQHPGVMRVRVEAV